MRTVKEMSRRTGVSVRTLHHYEAIGLLKPTSTTEAGYRLYDDASLEKLHMILVLPLDATFGTSLANSHTTQLWVLGPPLIRY